MRLIVTDNSTAARTMADRLANGKARGLEVHRVPVFEAGDEGSVTRVIGLGGLLFAPEGPDGEWRPSRRAPANALRLLARSAESLLLATDDPLLAVQARDVACAGRPLLQRAARVGDPWSAARHVDDLAAEARAAGLEIDAMFAAYVRPVDPELRRGDLAALGQAGRTPVAHRTLRDLGVSDGSLHRLAERGYLVADPAWRTPAGDLVCEAVDAAVLKPAFGAQLDAWVNAVGRGSLTRTVARQRAAKRLAGLHAAVAVKGIAAGRLLGVCPECGDWMGGALERLQCKGCGHGYRLPKRVEALAVPGAVCEACDAPMIVPVIHGRRDEPRCPDTTGCPTRLGDPVGR